jgi:hypothetical protein
MPVIREPEKCSEIGWFSPGQTPPNLAMIPQENLEHYLNKWLPESNAGHPVGAARIENR